MITCSTDNAFTLPVGARRDATVWFRVADTDTTNTTELVIYASGGAQLSASGTGAFVASLEGVNFRAGG